MRVLGIETSCDETGVAVYDSGTGAVTARLFSQVALHAEYGGVVPEIASRDHVIRLVPLIRETCAAAGLDLHALDAVAYTAGPGLIGALLVGAAVGRSLAYALGVPSIAVHHMEGHLLAPLLEPDPPDFPFLALLVSGGHTQLVRVQAVGEYTILGESQDDAVGEAFDKLGKALGLGYPGGPEVERLAASGNPGRFRFPRPMTQRGGLDFSFSGLKTHAMTALARHADEPGVRADIARAFLDAIVDTLAIKCRRALDQTGLTRLVVAGGVSANRRLRSRLAETASACAAQVYFPRLEFCTDNGAMIAYAGFRRLAQGAGSPSDLSFQVRARWPLAELTAPDAAGSDI